MNALCKLKVMTPNMVTFSGVGKFDCADFSAGFYSALVDACAEIESAWMTCWDISSRALKAVFNECEAIQKDVWETLNIDAVEVFVTHDNLVSIAFSWRGHDLASGTISLPMSFIDVLPN